MDVKLKGQKARLDENMKFKTNQHLKRYQETSQHKEQSQRLRQKESNCEAKVEKAHYHVSKRRLIVLN